MELRIELSGCISKRAALIRAHRELNIIKYQRLFKHVIYYQHFYLNKLYFIFRLSCGAPLVQQFVEFFFKRFGVY